MKKITWLLPLVLIPMFTDAQKKNDRKTIGNLQLHINYLSSDKLEGRKTGAPGEQLAAAYIASQLQQTGISPKGDNGFLQTFTVKETREPAEACTMTINHVQLTAGKQFIPLPFSAGKPAKGEVLPNVNEPDNIWLVNINELEQDGHKNKLEQYQQQTQIAAKSGATGIIFYNGKESPAEITRWLEQSPAPAAIPAIWVNTDISKQLDAEDANAFLINMQVAFKKIKNTGTNVIGYIDNNAQKTVVIGAHYDHLGAADGDNKSICQGANDNASGTAALLELARQLKSSRYHNHNYVIVAFSGKEQGLCGSKYFTTHSPVDLLQVNYMINMDKIGQLDADKGLQVGGIGTSPEWPAIISDVAARETRLVYDSSGVGPSDHTSFYRKNIPVLCFFTGGPAGYHQAGDNADRINYEGTVSVLKLVYDIIGKTNNMNKLAFSSTHDQEPATAKK